MSASNLPRDKDFYVDYPFEEVMFRWDHVENKVYRRFYGEKEHPDSIPHDNRLYTDALLYGDQTTKEKYEEGAPRSDNNAS